MMKCIKITDSKKESRGQALLTFGVGNECYGCDAYDDGMCVSMVGCPKERKKEQVLHCLRCREVIKKQNGYKYCPYCGGKL